MLRELAKRFVSAGNVQRIRKVKRAAERYVLRHTSKHRFASRLYYAFLSDAFSREQKGVLYGRFKYIDSLDMPARSQFLLRRNVHRIEKGLLMRPRRSVFATGYIEDTVAAYVQGVALENGRQEESTELRWASDVLRSYFNAVSNHEAIDRAREKFQSACAVENGSAENTEAAPYKRDLNTPPPVDYDAFFALSRRRRSVRWFLPRKVPRAAIDKAILAAAQAPSACNRQPFKFRVFDDPSRVREVIELPMGTKGYAHNVPAVAVVIGRLSAYFSERDRHLIYIDGALASMAFMYALETLSLSSCPINWPDIEAREQKMTRALDLEPDERPIMLIAIGYPDPTGMVAFSQKRDLGEIRQYN